MAPIEAIFEEMYKVEIAPNIAQELLGAFRKRRLMSTLAQTAWEASEGSKTQEDVFNVLSEFDQQEKIEDQTIFVSDNLAELKHRTLEKPGLRWRLNCLNSSLGSLRKGNFGFVFSRPETGKTTFLASEVTFMASQTDRPVLWFNNEEEGDAVMTRIFQAALGVNLVDLYADVENNQILYNELTNGNIHLYDDANISYKDIEKICAKLNPALVVIDQADKIKGFEADRKDLQLGAIYQWARSLAKQYCPVIGICQADGSGDGQKWLTMHNVADAKTSKQAEADWILGIGKSYDPQEEYVRYFNISKNKLMGDGDTDPALRHGRLKCLINPMIARYEDMAK